MKLAAGFVGRDQAHQAVEASVQIGLVDFERAVGQSVASAPEGAGAFEQALQARGEHHVAFRTSATTRPPRERAGSTARCSWVLPRRPATGLRRVVAAYLPLVGHVVEGFLGEWRPDFWISDCYGGQMGWAKREHQVCLAHLIRDVQYAVDGPIEVLSDVSIGVRAMRGPCAAARAGIAGCFAGGPAPLVGRYRLYWPECLYVLRF